MREQISTSKEIKNTLSFIKTDGTKDKRYTSPQIIKSDGSRDMRTNLIKK